MQRTFPIVIEKTGEKFIPTFPIELKEGTQLILAKEMMGSQVPEGKTWIIEGWTNQGPILTQKPF